MIDLRRRELELVAAEYGELDHAPNHDWVIVSRWHLPSGWNKPETRMLVLIRQAIPSPRRTTSTPMATCGYPTDGSRATPVKRNSLARAGCSSPTTSSPGTGGRRRIFSPGITS